MTQGRVMAEPACKNAICPPGREPMASIGYLGGWPTAYVLEKIGAALRQQYLPLIEAPLPETIMQLVQRLPTE